MSRKGFVAPLILVGVVVLMLIVGGVYYLGTRQGGERLPLSPNMPTTPNLSSTPVNPSPYLIGNQTSDWKILQLKNVGALQYPPTWKFSSEAPSPYKDAFRGWGSGTQCSGGYLQDTRTVSSLIAIEAGNSDLGEGGYCWSSGEFGQRYSRINLFTGKIIDVSWWSNNNVWVEMNAPVDTDSGRAIVLFLLQKEGKGSPAEETFDQIASTFKLEK